MEIDQKGIMYVNPGKMRRNGERAILPPAAFSTVSIRPKASSMVLPAPQMPCIPQTTRRNSFIFPAVASPIVLVPQSIQGRTPTPSGNTTIHSVPRYRLLLSYCLQPETPGAHGQNAAIFYEQDVPYRIGRFDFGFFIIALRKFH